MTKRLKAVEQAAKTTAPATTIKRGTESWPANPDLRLLVAEGYDLKQEMNTLKAVLDEVHSKIIQELALLEQTDGTVHIIAEGIDCVVAFKDSVQVADPEGVKAVLGDRYHDLVREKITYGVERKLIEIAIDADHPQAEALRACLENKETKPSITYKML